MACSRDCKKTGLAAVAAFVVFNILEFLVHGQLFMSAYAAPEYQSVWNPQAVMGSRMMVSLAGYVLYCIAFVLTYTRGYEDAKPALGQGVRFGLLAGLLVFPYHALINYMVYPVSLNLALAWIAAGVVESIILGAVVASIYRPAAEAPHTH